jgi:hypothetical protein
MEDDGIPDAAIDEIAAILAAAYLRYRFVLPNVATFK